MNVALRRAGEWVQVLRYGALAGLADLRALYTWRSWTFGWLSRVLSQVIFFALIGELVGSRDVLRYLLIGSAVSIVVMESLLMVHSTTWERRSGTLPLIVAAPTSPVLVFFGRSLQWVASGTASAVIALTVLLPLFRVPVALPRALWVVPIVAAVGVSAYCFGLFLSGLVLRVMALRSMLTSFTWLIVSIFAGVYFPPSAMPAWAEAVGAGLPARHGLTAIRLLLDGAPVREVLATAVWELAVGAGWLVLAAVSLHRLVDQGRRDGSIEFSD